MSENVDVEGINRLVRTCMRDVRVVNVNHPGSTSEATLHHRDVRCLARNRREGNFGTLLGRLSEERLQQSTAVGQLKSRPQYSVNDDALQKRVAQGFDDVACNGSGFRASRNVTSENDDDEILTQGLMWTNGQKLEFSSMLNSGS